MPATHPVAQILCRRRDEGSLPGARTDGCRVGLAVEGGGMRGVVSGAMMTALMDRELERSFDVVHAFSAGAINSAYFLAGMGWYALSVYYDDLTSRAFLDVRRVLGRQPVLSLDYVMDVVMETAKPLDYEAVLASPIELHIAVSSIRDLKPRVFTHIASKDELKVMLKASACIPMIAGAPIAYEGDLLLDGGLLLAHPVLTALENGCTHVLAIRTRVDGIIRAAPSRPQRLIARYLQCMRSGLGAAYLDTVERYGQLRHHLQEVSRRQEGPPFILDVACPAGAHRVTGFSQDRGVLFQGIRAGYRTMIEAIEGRSDQVYLRPTLFERP